MTSLDVQSIVSQAQSYVPLQTYSVEDFLSLDLPEPKFLLHPWLPEAGLAMIHAATGVGKTLFGLSSAIAIASGRSFLRFTAKEPSPVFYLDGEMPSHLMRLRIAQAIKLAGNPECCKLRLYCWAMTDKGAPDLSTQEGQSIVDDVIGDARVIFVDNLSAFCRTGKDNEAESWRQMDDWLLSHRRAGRAVVLIHHDGKSGEQRGTSKKGDKLDTIIQLVPPLITDKSVGAHFEVHFKKKRHFWGDDANPFDAKLTDTGWIMDEVRNEPISVARTMKNEGASLREIEKTTGIPRSTLSRQLGVEI